MNETEDFRRYIPSKTLGEDFAKATILARMEEYGYELENIERNQKIVERLRDYVFSTKVPTYSPQYMDLNNIMNNKDP